MYKHMLIATDGSKIAQAAVGHGLELAKALGAKVILLTVTEGWSVLEAAHKAEMGVRNPIGDFRKLADQHAADALAAAQSVAKTIGVACESEHVRESHPAEAIVAAAKRHDCNLIVMGSHGRRGLGQMLLGSQTARVLAQTSVPVLVYR